MPVHRNRKTAGVMMKPQKTTPVTGFGPGSELQACDCNSSAPNKGCPRGYYCKGLTTTGRCTCVKR